MGVTPEKVDGPGIEADDFGVHVHQGTLKLAVKGKGLLINLEARQGQTQFLQHVENILESLGSRGRLVQDEPDAAPDRCRQHRVSPKAQGENGREVIDELEPRGKSMKGEDAGIVPRSRKPNG